MAHLPTPPGTARHREDIGTDHRAGDGRRQTLRRRGKLRQLLSLREKPAHEQRQKERREQPQMREQVFGLGPAPAGWKRRTLPAATTTSAGASTTGRSNKPTRSSPPKRWPANWPRPRGT